MIASPRFNLGDQRRLRGFVLFSSSSFHTFFPLLSFPLLLLVLLLSRWLQSIMKWKRCLPFIANAHRLKASVEHSSGNQVLPRPPVPPKQLNSHFALIPSFNDGNERQKQVLHLKIADTITIII